MYKFGTTHKTSFTAILVAALSLLPLSNAAATPTYELRSLLGIGLSSPTQLNSGVSEKAKTSELYPFGADALAHFEGGWAAGLRFDSISSLKADEENAVEIGVRLFSLLLERRYEFGKNFFSPIVSLGIYQPSVVNQRVAGGPWVQYTANQVRSLSLGFGFGWLLDIYILGFEAGYQYLQLKDFSGSDGSRLLDPSGNEKVADLSHPYFKLAIGFQF